VTPPLNYPPPYHLFGNGGDKDSLECIEEEDLPPQVKVTSVSAEDHTCHVHYEIGHVGSALADGSGGAGFPIPSAKPFECDSSQTR
jgi:hypothetical protein